MTTNAARKAAESIVRIAERFPVEEGRVASIIDAEFAPLVEAAEKAVELAAAEHAYEIVSALRAALTRTRQP